jgi:hypothetical protein
MSRRRVLLLLPALAALAAVSACSSSGNSSPASGGATSSRAVSSAAGASTPSVQVGLLTEWFDTPLPSDQAQAAVVEDFRQGLLLYDKSQEDFSLVSPVTSWVTGSALTDLKQTLSTLEKNELVPAGVDRLFRTGVTALSGSAATITTCDDGSKYNEQNPRTHAISPSSEHLPLNQEYIFITWDMTRADGHWAIRSITIASSSSAAAKSCLPGG